MLPLAATGLNSSLAIFIFSLVSAATWSFDRTSIEVVLVTLRTLIKSSSSTNDPGICGIAMDPSFPTV